MEIIADKFIFYKHDFSEVFFKKDALRFDEACGVKGRKLLLRFPLREAFFDEKRAERQQRGDAKQEGSEDGPAMFAPRGEHQPTIGDEQNAVRPASPLDEFGPSGDVFERHGDADEYDEGNGLKATSETKGG
jgi:hypothetical protein